MNSDRLFRHLETRLKLLKAGRFESVESRDELLKACKDLNRKLADDYNKLQTNLGKPPQPFPPFSPSERLASLQEKRDVFRNYTLQWKQWRKLSKRQREGKKVLRPESPLVGYGPLDKLLAEIKILHIQEREEYRIRKRDYERDYAVAMKEYEDNKQKNELARREILEKQRKVEEIKGDIIRTYDQKDSEKQQRVNWRILPPGKWSIHEIKRHFREIETANPVQKFDLNRLEMMEHLNPTTCYVGQDEFTGYVVFCFDYTEKTVLENPVWGNAIYVIHSDWQEMSRLTKRELLAANSANVERIVHRGDWFERLKEELVMSVAARTV